MRAPIPTPLGLLLVACGPATGAPPSGPPLPVPGEAPSEVPSEAAGEAAGDAGHRPPIPGLPLPRDGADVLGTRLGNEFLTDWLGDPLPLQGPGAARATLLRWWTDTCPYCEASLPALDDLRLRYADQGLVTVAVYHPKPPRDVPAAEVRGAARDRSYAGPLAVDRDWRALKELWLDTGRRRATSASFLLDATGSVRFVHPGPIFHPARAPDEEGTLPVRDHADLEAAIAALLAEGESD